MPGSWTPGDASEQIPSVTKGNWMGVNKPNFKPDEGGQSRNGANAFLENITTQKRIFLWVNDVTANFEMGGSTAQSKHRREFFPNNFQQPTITISGQTPNQGEWNRIGAFIRDTQIRAVKENLGSNLVRLWVRGGGEETRRPITKGRHRPIGAVGYILASQRGGERFVNAPDFSFDFIIVQATHFLGLEDRITDIQKMRTIMGILRTENFRWEKGKPAQPEKQDKGHPTDEDDYKTDLDYSKGHWGL